MPLLVTCWCLSRSMRHCSLGRWTCQLVSEISRLVWRCRLFGWSTYIPSCVHWHGGRCQQRLVHLLQLNHSKIYSNWKSKTFFEFHKPTPEANWWNHKPKLKSVVRKHFEIGLQYKLLTCAMGKPLVWSYLTNPSARAGYDTRSIFKRSLTGLNSEFSFS